MSTLIHVPTKLGKIAVEIEARDGAMPVIFLHGVYLDRHLWDAQAAVIRDRTVIILDMPYHGESTDTPFGWNLDDCAGMLLQILECCVLTWLGLARCSERQALLGKERAKTSVTGCPCWS